MPANVFGPADVGRTVTLRTVTRVGPADVVGTLLAVSATEIVVRRRDGQSVTIAADSVTHGRLVPPTAAQTTGAAELERVIAEGWRAIETEQLGEWLLRASGGFTRRGNSALAIGDPARPLDDALAAVVDWYAVRGLSPRVQLPLDGAADVVAEALRRAGWRAEMIVHVMTSELAPVLRAAPRDASVAVRIDDEPDDAWLAVYRSEAGRLPDTGPRELLVNHPAVGFASVRAGDGCRAIARAAVDGRWTGLFAVEVARAHRGRGLGATVSVEVLRWAAQRGARRAYLQVAAGNDAAVALYQRLGFALHHDYEHYVLEEAADASK